MRKPSGFLPWCEENQLSVILGVGYNNGIFASGAVLSANFNHARALEAVWNARARWSRYAGNTRCRSKLRNCDSFSGIRRL